YGDGVKLLVLTGARRREVAGMEWRELSDDLAVWELPAARSKNKLPHVVFLPPMAREIVARAPRFAGSRHVFTYGKTEISAFARFKKELDDVMLRIAKEEARKAGRDASLVEITPWRIHDLRRTAVTGMCDLGVLPHVVEAVVNHVSGHKAGVAGVYNKAVYAAEKKEALERWARHVQGVVSGQPARVVPIGRGRRA